MKGQIEHASEFKFTGHNPKDEKNSENANVPYQGKDSFQLGSSTMPMWALPSQEKQTRVKVNTSAVLSTIKLPESTTPKSNQQSFASSFLS